jgi:hypothetical protein
MLKTDWIFDMIPCEIRLESRWPQRCGKRSVVAKLNSNGFVVYCCRTHSRSKALKNADSPAWWECANCGKIRENHADNGKCLYEPTTFKAIER